MNRIVRLTAVFFVGFNLVAFSGCKSESVLLFKCGSFAELPLVALNPNAKKAMIKNPEYSSYAYFSFSQDQLAFIKAASSSWQSVSFKTSVAVAPDKNSVSIQDSQTAFGLLYGNDFDDRGKLKKNLGERPVVKGFFGGEEKTVAISIAVGKENLDDVRGFFVYSTSPVHVKDIEMIPARLGFDFSGDIHSYFFGLEGGKFPAEDYFSFADFTDADSLFGAKDNRGGRRSVISLSLSSLDSQPPSPKEQERVELDIGGERILVRRTMHHDKVTLHACALENPYSKVTPILLPKHVTAVTMHHVDAPVEAGKVVVPLDTDPGMIPLWEKSFWRVKDYELFQWEQFPGLLFFDTADYSVQDDFFKRLAFFTEKAGYVGTLVSDKEMKNQHGFNAHDYRAETLGSFFDLAHRTNFPLNPKELVLKDILVHNGIIVPVERDGTVIGYKSGYGGVISISQDSAMYLRYTFICHEGLHGLYFVDEPFRSYVSTVFAETDKDTLRFLLRYFQIQASLNYNLDDTYLIQNEFMAYVMQQPVSRTGPYFAENLAWRGSMLRSEPELSAYVRKTKGIGFTEASQRLSDYVFARWGMESGRVSLVSR